MAKKNILQFGGQLMLMNGIYLQYDPPPPPVGAFVVASGGTETVDGDYKIHTFTSLATGTFTVTNGGDVSILLLAGGGGGANCAPSNQRGGAGGGAGGLIICTSTLSATAYSIQVGSGGKRIAGSLGQAGVDGSVSTAFGMTATGGGGGGSYGGVGRNGGSGGGGGIQSAKAGGTGVSGQGFAGGAGAVDGFQRCGGGGGGALSVGQVGQFSNNPAAGGTGFTIWAKTYAVGGPGGYGQKSAEPNPSNGYGHGGAGGGNDWGAKGSDGTVIIRYKFQ